MSYEVYIDVVHHPRHCDDFEHKLGDASRWVEPKDAAPSAAERLTTVVNALRALADRLDPEWTCTHCGMKRHEHHDWEELPRCFNRFGPVTQWAWWQESEGGNGP